jgi:DNA-binding transcriptional MerR regulator
MSDLSLKRLFDQEDRIPEKLFYKIGEVSRIAGVEPYVLRYWETEFPFLRPRKTASGQRIYSRKDLEMVLQIKKLLYEERYTIEGVRKKFGDVTPVRVVISSQPSDDTKEILERIKKRLRDILAIL